MSDTQTEQTVGEQIAERTRYTGAGADFEALVVLDEEEILNEDLASRAGRPSVDLTPYKQEVSRNFAKNKNSEKTGKSVAYTVVVDTEAVSTLKSRFGSAAAELKVGLRWFTAEVPNTKTEESPNGKTKVQFVAGKRLEGRGRKAGTRNGS